MSSLSPCNMPGLPQQPGHVHVFSDFVFLFALLLKFPFAVNRRCPPDVGSSSHTSCCRYLTYSSSTHIGSTASKLQVSGPHRAACKITAPRPLPLGPSIFFWVLQLFYPPVNPPVLASPLALPWVKVRQALQVLCKFDTLKPHL